MLNQIHLKVWHVLLPSMPGTFVHNESVFSENFLENIFLKRKDVF